MLSWSVHQRQVSRVKSGFKSAVFMRRLDPTYNLVLLCGHCTVIMRVIAHFGVIASIGVIAPLCDIFQVKNRLNHFPAQLSESSHRGAMTPTVVLPSGVR